MTVMERLQMWAGNLGAISPTSVWISVDSTKDHDPAGRLASPFYGVQAFSGVLAFVNTMEQLYNETRFPQSTVQIRSFHQ